MSSNQSNQTGNEEGTQDQDKDKGISRRRLLQYTCGCMGTAALMSIGGSVNAFAAGGAKKQTGLPREGDVLVVVEETAAIPEETQEKVLAGSSLHGEKPRSSSPETQEKSVKDNQHERTVKPVTLSDLKVDGEPLLVFPKDPKGAVREEENSKILLFRTTPDKFSPSVKSSSVQGVIAYSALCTHLGCVLTNWNDDKKLMVCPCHDATFDPYDKANFTNPGPRPLPILPIKIENNQFIVTDDFSGWVGANEG